MGVVSGAEVDPAVADEVAREVLAAVERLPGASRVDLLEACPTAESSEALTRVLGTLRRAGQVYAEDGRWWRCQDQEPQQDEPPAARTQGEQIAEVLRAADVPLTAAEIADATGLARKRVGVLLPGLERIGRVTVDRSGRPYRYGYPVAAEMAQRMRERVPTPDQERRALAWDATPAAAGDSSERTASLQVWKSGDPDDDTGGADADLCARLRDQVQAAQALLEDYVFAQSDPVLAALVRALRASEDALDSIQATTQEG